MISDERQTILELIYQSRWASLATCGPDGPIASQVAYAPEPGLGGVLLLLSQLAAHTRAVLATHSAAISISETDDGREDPQTLRRIMLRGPVATIERSDPDHNAAAACYLDRLPAARKLLDFSDFRLLRLQVEEARYVGGLGNARTLSGAALRALEQPR